MTGFTDRTHTLEAKARIGAASQGRAAPNRGKPTSEETKAKQRAAKLGGTHPEEHKRRIGEAIRRANAEGRGARTHLTQMTEAELTDYLTLTRVGNYRKKQALMMVGRGDLIGLLKGWRKFLSDEEVAECRELRGRRGLGMAEALEAIGRGDLVTSILR